MTKSVKIIVHVPTTHTDEIIQAMGDAGAGIIGNYSHCSFSSRGTGRFLPQQGAQPAIGEVGTFEKVEEDRVEMTCNLRLVPDVVRAIKAVHPYEEPTYDIYERFEFTF